jgi:hypothetical protein
MLFSFKRKESVSPEDGAEVMATKEENQKLW